MTANQGQLARLGALIALLFKSTTKGCLKGCGVADRQVAASTTKVLSTVPKLTKGPNNQMLRDAIGHVKALKGDAKQKADLFENLAGQINKLSGGGWSASRSVATDGSHVFLGEAGEVLVIDSAGALFRGSATKGAVVFGSRGTTVNFALLRGI